VLAGLNFNYHNEHHRWPQVPSRHLPAVHRELTASVLAPYEHSPSYWASARELVRACRRHDAAG
jgi:fatty acid desaturase